MHAQASLLLALSAASALAASPDAYGVPSYNSTNGTAEASQKAHIADLKSEISSLKSAIESKVHASEECDVPSYTADVSRESTLGTASATYPAAYETAFPSGSVQRSSTPSATATNSANGTAIAPSGTGAIGSAISSLASQISASASSVISQVSGVVNSTSSASASATITTSSASLSSASSSTASSSSSSTESALPSYVPQLSDFTADQIASGQAWNMVSTLADARMKARKTNGSCTYETAKVRTEFRSMSNDQRKAFTDAMACLQNAGPRETTSGSTTYPGVRSRYDEYVATHINQTFNIHGTADFLAWHRNYIFTIEADLASTCGYTGTLPYWDWARDAEALQDSELFNGDAYSMGSNGMKIDGREDTFLGLMGFSFPPGTGGGCTLTGPFSNATGFETHLGPIDSPYSNNVANQFDYNPRCLVRDLNNWFSTQFNTYTNVTDLVLGESTIQDFQNLMQGYLGNNKLGVHGGGHWLGGGPSQLEDFHSSPNDPLFYLHHAMVDRIWTAWQYMDLENRLNAISGTSTLQNSPPSAAMTLDDTLNFGLIGEDERFGDLMDTLAGPYCYRYE